MVQPSGEGAERCMRMAMKTLNGQKIDYINTHGTSTKVGDSKEMGAIKAVFGNDVPAIGSTKSLTGHALGAAGSNEAIYSLLMMDNNFLAASAHIDQLDEEFEGLPILIERKLDQDIRHIMSNSFGFGGTNACLVFSKLD
jgi:3-oxoacyl-[acyl-carrier-protein] synthase-1